MQQHNPAIKAKALLYVCSSIFSILRPGALGLKRIIMASGIRPELFRRKGRSEQHRSVYLSYQRVKCQSKFSWCFPGQNLATCLFPEARGARKVNIWCSSAIVGGSKEETMKEFGFGCCELANTLNLPHMINLKKHIRSVWSICMYVCMYVHIIEV